MTFIIQDATVHVAFELLERNVETASVAAAMRKRREDEEKAELAEAFLAATGTVAEREAKARLDPAVKNAQKHFYEAIRAHERAKKEESKCAAIIDAWRTSQSTLRNMSRVG